MEAYGQNEKEDILRSLVNKQSLIWFDKARVIQGRVKHTQKEDQRVRKIDTQKILSAADRGKTITRAATTTERQVV